jgi:hypothetical protein
MDAVNPGFTAYTAYDPNGLRISDHEFYTDPDAIILSGQNLAAGALVGRVTASGKWILSLAAANDGSQVPAGVLLQAVDASGGDKKGLVALAGGFNADKLVFGTGHTFANTKVDLAARNIFLYDPAAL